jgi:hypothetical protein
MKTQTFFRLGALATILTAIGLTVGNLIYFFGTVETVFYIWFAYVVYTLWIFAYFAVFAVQVKRSNIFLLIGLVVLVIGVIFYIVQNTAEMAGVTGFVTQEQLEQTGQISSFAAVGLIAFWAFPLGSVLFGFGTFRAKIFPRWIGIMMILLGVSGIFFWNSAFAIVAIIQSVVWVSFGWTFWKLSGELEQ